MSNITVLLGSPRTNGNTARLVRSFVEGVNSRHKVDVVSVAKLHISPCLGCNSCFKNEEHKCCQQDDMQHVYELLSKTDVLVIATPVYFYGVSAQLKTLIDRLHNPVRDSFSISKMALLAVGAASLPNLFDPILMQYQMCLDFFHLENLGTVLVREVKDAGDIDGSRALLDAMSLGSMV